MLVVLWFGDEHLTQCGFVGASVPNSQLSLSVSPHLRPGGWSGIGPQFLLVFVFFPKRALYLDKRLLRSLQP